jgi:tetratricopeptide (TPR) repeat protein
MNKIFLGLLLFFSLVVCAQNDQLAQNYFDKGDFEKAKITYEELLKTNTGNGYYFQRLIECYQQLQLLDQAETLIQARLKQFNQSNLLVELGYNYQLKKDTDKSKNTMIRP